MPTRGPGLRRLSVTPGKAGARARLPIARGPIALVDESRSIGEELAGARLVGASDVLDAAISVFPKDPGRNERCLSLVAGRTGRNFRAMRGTAGGVAACFFCPSILRRRWDVFLSGKTDVDLCCRQSLSVQSLLQSGRALSGGVGALCARGAEVSGG